MEDDPIRGSGEARGRHGCRAMPRLLQPASAHGRLSEPNASIQAVRCPASHGVVVEGSSDPWFHRTAVSGSSTRAERPTHQRGRADRWRSGARMPRSWHAGRGWAEGLHHLPMAAIVGSAQRADTRGSTSCGKPRGLAAHGRRRTDPGLWRLAPRNVPTSKVRRC